MYIGLKNIQALFSEFPNYLTFSDTIHCLTGWEKLNNASPPYISHLLYVCEYTESISHFPFIEDMHILCTVNPGTDMNAIADQFSDSVSLLLVETADSIIVFTELQKYFNMQCGNGFYGQTLLDFLAFDTSLQNAIDYSFRVFGNPIFVFDANYNLIAATWDEIEKRGISEALVLNKRFSEDEFKMANRANHLHEKVKKSEIPIKAYNEILGYEQLYCSINTQKDLGHIVVSAAIRPFGPEHEEMLLTLKKYVNEQLKKDSFIRTSRGFNYEYFLRDLLDEKIATDRSLMTRMNYVECEFSGNMYCMVIETARSAGAVNVYRIRNMLESHLPNTKTLIYNGQIIVILSISDKQLIPKEYIQSASLLCIENGLFAGLSNCFQSIMKVKEYYNQALRAIELGICHTTEPALFVYEDYFLEHINSLFRQKESPAVFCHPKMKFLLDYDKLHHSELAYTLYMYLTHERNLASTSDAMHMHRTSLVYRFKKIYSLIGDDFDDYKTRLYMILSYEMNK